jgi:predicted restriction endonuclease
MASSMGFRERPEYQKWRDQVFDLFGHRCILCGHEGNTHAHHVRPVHTFPEYALDPKNGGPLCGNCHTEVNS